MGRSLELRLALLASLIGGAAGAAESTRLLRFPDVSADAVVFTYAGDLWRAPLTGGTATRLTAHPGMEVFARFSPDGRWIAFTGQYDGDEQVYVMPAAGGEPKQLTYYPANGPLPARWGYDNLVYGWTPDGESVLFRSLRYGYGEHPGQLYLVDKDGGPARPMPMPRAGAADFSPDGKRLVYSPLWRDFRTWKRYQGGWAQNLYIYDLASNATTPVSHTIRTERDPIWIGDSIYFVSDRSGTLNLYSFDVASGKTTPVTSSTRWDVRWASSDGQRRIVFEQAGELMLLDVPGGQPRALAIEVPDDGLSSRPARTPAEDEIEDFGISPQGERALFAARGDIFTAPIEKGPVRNLTNSSGAHDRAPRWSPDGKQIAFISDASGEEELWLVPQDGSGPARQLTHGHAARLYEPTWAPDGKRIVIADKEGRIELITVSSGAAQQIADERNYQSTDFAWSPCGQWLAFSMSQPNGGRALHLHSVASGVTTQVTDGFFSESAPSWDPEGKYLWFLTEREFAPQISTFEWNYATNRTTVIAALALRKDLPHPFPPQSDEVKPIDLTGPAGESGSSPQSEQSSPAGSKKPGEKGKRDGSKEGAGSAPGAIPAPTKIDLDGLGQRVSRAPISAENYEAVVALPGSLLYLRSSARFNGREPEAKPRLFVYDLEKRKETLLAEAVNGFVISADRKKLLALEDGAYALYDASASGKDSRKPVSTGGLVVERIPREEWRNIFHEVWRRYRDYFYVENMHGYDWKALREQYEPLLQHVAHRSDLNYLIGEMISELNIGHAYIDGGDWVRPRRAPVALLGARLDFEPQARAYRIGKIWRGQNVETRYRSPLTEVGVDVPEGSWLLAIDGEPLAADEDPFRLLRDKADRPIVLTIATTADGQGRRQVTVNPITNEGALIYLDWVERNRAAVERLSGGKLGYVHVPNMGADGAREFIKWFYPQARRNGMVIDDRSNGGGNISQWIIERLRRELLGTRFIRTAEDPGTYPFVVMRGPMAMLISESSASDGDIFPFMFREAGLGPLIGKRTWGGVIGITNHGPLIDGGSVSVPQFGTSSKDGRHVMEGEGVTPDIEVENDPASELAGRDNQLERAVAELMKALRENPHELPPRPADPVKTPQPIR